MAWLKEELVNILIKEEIISRADIPRVIAHSRENNISFFDALVEMNLVEKSALSMVLAKGLRIPFVSLSKLKIPATIIQMLPVSIIKRYKLLPISLVRDVLTVAIVDPWNYVAIDDVRLRLEKQVAVALVSEDELNKVISELDENYNAEQLHGLIEDFSAEEVELVSSQRKQQIEALDEKNVEEVIAPAVRAVNKIVELGVQLKASDIFIEPMESCVRVRYRVDGILQEGDTFNKGLHDAIISRIKILGRMDISEHRLPQDGKFRMEMENRYIDFRISIVPSAMGEKACLRILDKGAVMLNLDDLGFFPDTLERLKDCVRHPHGMFVVTGPTGSGKSTTLYSILQYIDSPDKNVITVEDPVEYQMKGINQVQVNPDVGLTFASALRSILRQDPDVILIGEIRDLETMDIAIKAALTGHLVLTTLHTNTAPGAIVRMLNMGVEPFLITASVIGIMGQRLLRKLCEHCKESYVMTDELADKLKISQEYVGKTFYRPVGCKHCLNMGYKGRTNVAELMVMSPSLRNLISKGEEEPRIRQLAIEEGMRLMRDDGLKKAAEGLTSIEEVLRVTS